MFCRCCSAGELHLARCDVQLEVLGRGGTQRRDVVEADLPDSRLHGFCRQSVPSLSLPSVRVASCRYSDPATTSCLHPAGSCQRYLHLTHIITCASGVLSDAGIVFVLSVCLFVCVSGSVSDEKSMQLGRNVCYGEQ